MFYFTESPSLPIDPQQLPCDIDCNVPESTAIFAAEMSSSNPQQLPCDVDCNVPESAAFVAAEMLSSNLVQNLLKSNSFTSTNSPTATNSPITPTNSPTPGDHLATTVTSSQKQEEIFDLGDLSDWLMDRSEKMSTSTFNGVFNHSDCMDVERDFEGYSLHDFDTMLELFITEEEKRPSLTVGPMGSIACENLGNLTYPVNDYIEQREY